MTLTEIKNLPDEFDFKSTLNALVSCYHAKKVECGYVVMGSGGKWFFNTSEFRNHLLNDEYIPISKEGEIKMNDTFYIIKNEELGTYVKTNPLWEENEDAFFTAVSKTICFDDCSDENVVAIFYKGKEVEYAGWKPGMKYEYKYLNGETAWVGEFPHWDH